MDCKPEASVPQDFPAKNPCMTLLTAQVSVYSNSHIYIGRISQVLQGRPSWNQGVRNQHVQITELESGGDRKHRLQGASLKGHQVSLFTYGEAAWSQQPVSFHKLQRCPSPSAVAADKVTRQCKETNRPVSFKILNKIGAILY